MEASMGTRSAVMTTLLRGGRGPELSGDRGASLVELMVSLALISVTILAIASLVSTGTFINHTAASLTSVTTVATQRVSQISSLSYWQITIGGSLANDVTGFADMVDVDGDGVADVSVRWLVTDLGTGKRIEVFANAQDAVNAARQSITLVALVTKP
jgi:hypothetical protein